MKNLICSAGMLALFLGQPVLAQDSPSAPEVKVESSAPAVSVPDVKVDVEHTAPSAPSVTKVVEQSAPSVHTTNTETRTTRIVEDAAPAAADDNTLLWVALAGVGLVGLLALVAAASRGGSHTVRRETVVS